MKAAVSRRLVSTRCTRLAHGPLTVEVTLAAFGATQQAMTPEEALGWLRQVKGQLYRNNPHPSGTQAWVAVVRTPRSGTRNGKLIVALGSSMEEAAAAAERQWHEVWRGMSQTH